MANEAGGKVVMKIAGAILAGAIPLLILALSGCRVDSDPAMELGIGSIDLSNSQLAEPLIVPTAGDAQFFAAGTRSARWVELGHQLCVRSARSGASSSAKAGDMSVACTDFEPGPSVLDEATFSWNSDESTLYFTPNRLTAPESDIWAFTPSTNKVSNLTDDGVSSPIDPAADTDILPFAAANGDVHFIRLPGQEARSAATPSVHMIDGTGGVSDIEIDVGPVLPVPGIHPVGQDQFLFIGFERSVQSEHLLLLDLATDEVRPIRTRGLIGRPFIAASSHGVAILGNSDLQSDGQFEYVLVDLVDGSNELIDLGLEPSPAPPPGVLPSPNAAFAFSPDGASFVALVRARIDEPLGLVGYERTPDGGLSGPFPVAEPGFLGFTDDGSLRSVAAPRTNRPILWTNDDELVFLTSDDAAMFFMLTSDQ